MKKKKIKKLAKNIVKAGKEYERSRYTIEEPKEATSEFVYCDYDKKTSEKFSKFVLNLIKLKEKLNIEFYETEFNIYCDMNKMRNKNKNYNEESFDIKVNKTGFRIRRNYLTYIGYKDSNIYDILKDQIIEKSKLINEEIINETIDNLTVELNLSRDNNLDEILN